MSIKLNIKEAKQEVINTVRAYLKKDETGAYEIPPERQRPILSLTPSHTTQGRAPSAFPSSHARNTAGRSTQSRNIP